MKFSIVTPVYNSEKYIAETIESVLSQEGDFEIEYIVQDGGSSDRTGEVVQTYINCVKSGDYPIHCNKISMQYFSEKDNGMYDAIEKGFSQSTGDIMAYINADDKYLPGAFAAVASVFSTYPEIEWVKGISELCDESGRLMSKGSCYAYRRSWVTKGIYGRSAPFIQQESVFWKKSLWENAKPSLSSFRLAGDYALWKSFASKEALWSLNRRVSIFRKHPRQLSSSMQEYRLEQEKIAPHNFFLEKRVVLFFSLRRLLKLDPRGIITQILFFVFFPFCRKEWYIDFDVQGEPLKKRTSSYIAQK